MKARKVSSHWSCLILAAGLTVALPQPVSAAGEQTTETLQAEAGPVEGADLQVLLIFHGLLPGLIDGEPGPQTREALAAFQEDAGLPASGILDDATRAALREGAPDETLVEYRISPADVAGPFGFEFPEDVKKLKVLPPYGQLSPVHFLAKKYRTTPEFLRKLNPKSGFEAGDVIRVPNVAPAAQQR